MKELKVLEESDRVKESFQSRVWLEGNILTFYPVYLFEIKGFPNGKAGVIEKQGYW